MGLCFGKQLPTAPPPWSDLPPELAGLVLCRLPSHTDRLSFQAVCRQWRLAARQQHPLPAPALLWLSLDDGRAFQSLPGGELLRFTDKDLHASAACIGCVEGWLLCERYNSNRTRTRFLNNPFSGATIQLPAFRFDGLVKSHVARPTEFLRRVVVCSPEIVAASFYWSEVAFCRPGAPTWSVCPSYRRRGWYTDIAFHRGKFYALNTEGALFAHDLGDDNVGAGYVEHVIKAEPLDADPEEQEFHTRMMRYLVASCGKLLMVQLSAPLPLISGCRKASRKVSEKIALKVLEAELSMHRWSEVKNLGDAQALFVGGGCSKAVLLSGHDQRFQGNRVYFLGVDAASCCLELEAGNVPSYGFYDLTNGRISQVFLNGRGDIRHVYRSQWFFPCM